MKPSQSLSESAAAAKPPPYCAFPNCKVPPRFFCSRCKETENCSNERQTDHWKWHKKICVAPQKKMSAPVPPPPPLPLKPPSCCGYPGCSEPAPLRCTRCEEIHYCSMEHQKLHWKRHKKICVPPDKNPPPSGPPAPPVPFKGSFKEEEGDKNTCIICLDNVVNAKLRPCGHSATCRECTDELMNLKEPCPLCRKKIAGMDIGRWQSSIGEHGIWPTLLKNLTQLANGEGFNEYFQKHFNGNEEAYLRWKEVFDVLEIGNARDVGPNLPLELQVLIISKSEDLVKLRALAELCSKEYFDDPSLLVVAWRRILEVLVLGMPPVVDEKKARGKKKQKKKKKSDPRKLEILDACAALGTACNWVRDMDDARRYYKRAKEGYEEQLGPDSKKALETTFRLIAAIN